MNSGPSVGRCLPSEQSGSPALVQQHTEVTELTAFRYQYSTADMIQCDNHATHNAHSKYAPIASERSMCPTVSLSLRLSTPPAHQVGADDTPTTTLDEVLPTADEAYGGNPPQIPGLIEAEEYDVGGEGVAYSDADESNIGGVSFIKVPLI